MPTYAARRRLKYTATQLFDVVADVDHYPEFMPWIVASHICVHPDHTFLAYLTIGAGPIRKKFSTTGVLHRPHRIEITSNDPIFDRYEQRWTFHRIGKDETNVEGYIDVQLRSRVLNVLIAPVFAQRAAATVSAYIRRAHRLYGARS